MQGRKLALVVLSTNREKIMLTNVPSLLAAVDAADVGSYVFVDIGH